MTQAKIRLSLWPVALLAALLQAGCQPASAPAGHAPQLPAQASQRAASRPVEAAYVLRDRLLAHDGAGFARLAVPPALHAQLAQAWTEGRSRWPLDELPLDARIPPMLAALQAPGAETALMTTFRKQFAGADADIDQAIRTLVVFGGEYVQKEAAYTPEERDHIAQSIRALGDWGVRAPLSDPARARSFFTALCAAARRSGIDGKAMPKAFARLGMTQSLNRLSPFLSTLLDQLRRQYGLDIDASLRSLQVELMQQTGDSARLRLRYELAGQPVDAVVPAVRIDGHWYLANLVRRAQASAMGGDAPPPP
ncbi:MAG: hypothetical protein QM612_02905 [Thermomonas sp.]|uniref:hypothetical protein n=1 Tax=Thermomonas sp. TaxID=1971895 RepID=UPI0039E41196